MEKVTQKSDESQVDGGQRNLPRTRKIYEFYNAPIVKFWFHTVGHHKKPWISRILLWFFEYNLMQIFLCPTWIYSHLVLVGNGKTF